MDTDPVLISPSFPEGSMIWDISAHDHQNFIAQAQKIGDSR